MAAEDNALAVAVFALDDNAAADARFDDFEDAWPPPTSSATSSALSDDDDDDDDEDCRYL